MERGRGQERGGAVRICVLAACAASACGPTAEAGGQAVGVLPAAPYGDLDTLVRDLFIPGADSNAYVAPKPTELASFQSIVAMISSRAFDAAKERAAGLGYELWHLDDPNAAGLVVLVENSVASRGGGTYVFDVAADPTRVIEVPHPIADVGTLSEGVQLFKQAHAGALLIAGTHRCASLASTSCLGADTTNACAGRLRMSDAAHFDGSYFHRVHEALFRLWPASHAVSLHAHADSVGQPDLTLSAGTRADVAPDALPNLVRDGLRAAGFTASSCNTASDPAPRLCGESNVQGRASNGAADACLGDAARTGERFLHVEQSATALSAPAPLVAALAGLL